MSIQLQISKDYQIICEFYIISNKSPTEYYCPNHYSIRNIKSSDTGKYLSSDIYEITTDHGP